MACGGERAVITSQTCRNVFAAKPSQARMCRRSRRREAVLAAANGSSTSVAPLRLERRIRRKSLEMRALHEWLAEIVGVGDLRDDGQPDVAVRGRHAVVVLRNRRIRTVGDAVFP